MPTLTFANYIDAFVIDPIGRFLFVMILFVCSFGLTYLLCLAYLHRKGLPSLERPAFGDRDAQGRVTWQVITMRIKPDMDAALKLSLVLTRACMAALALCVLSIVISVFRGH